MIFLTLSWFDDLAQMLSWLMYPKEIASLTSLQYFIEDSAHTSIVAHHFTLDNIRID